MNRFEFYKELNYKEEEKKNEINNSLSLPISIITGIIASTLYLLTNFDFKENLWNTIIFLLITLCSLSFLGKSIFHIIKSYSDFHNGYFYIYLADTLDLDNYHTQLKEYYKTNSNLQDTSDEEFEEFIISELVKNTDQNQKNNKQKSYHRYVSKKNLITAFFILSLNLFPFSYNYCFKQDKKETISVEIKLPQKIKLNSKNNCVTIDSLTLKYEQMNQPTPPPKPTPPPSQIIKEGQNPKPKPTPPSRPTPRPRNP